MNNKYTKRQLIEFAKSHVKQALEQASKKAFVENCEGEYESIDFRVNKKSILRAYPLNNIK